MEEKIVQDIYAIYNELHQCTTLEIKTSKNIVIQIDYNSLLTWSYDKFTDILTLNFLDGSTWKFEKEFNKFYKLD